MDNKVRIVQISDLHLYADQQETLLGVNTYESFSAVLNLLKADPLPPDIILLSGDLTQDHSKMSYQYVVDAFKAFPAPVYYVPGNHDDKALMTQVLPSAAISNLKHIVLDHWQLILLDSLKFQAVEGYLDPAQLDFLTLCLKQYPAHRAIIVFHHHPIPVGAAWLDKLGLTNAAALWQTLASYPNAHTILFGHVHQEHAGTKQGINYYATPSTCIQFKRNSADFALEKLSPAYRWLDLHPNGNLTTGICRLPHYIGTFQTEAAGY
jgi:Icc protein